MNADNFRVLLVDDEVEFLETLIKRMRKRGIDATGAGGGMEALGIMERQPADVVVMDVRMPGMDGIETLRQFKKKYPLVEVIMLTGHASLEAAREGMEIGAFDYLMKPVDFDELLYKIEDAHRKIIIQKEKIKRLDQVMSDEK